jgi:ABC-type lipoprotein release transport system permease subunit
MYTRRTLLDQPQRLSLAVGGVALCVILMLFLLSVYRGVAVGSIEYVASSDADLWVLQRHATNVLRSTSLLNQHHGNRLGGDPAVESVAPVLFILCGVETRNGMATTYLTGFDPKLGRGGPPAITAGRSVAADDEIILDRSFAAKHGLSINDRLVVKDETLTVVGLSSGTNMFVVQYAFVTLERARSLAGIPEVVSAYQLRLRPSANLDVVSERIARALPDVAVYDRPTFLANNLREMESGVLPLLYVVALIGAVVLTAILSLILSVNVLERRKDLAVMKALGAPGAFIPALVIEQAAILAGSGTVLGIALFFPLVRLVERVAPEVSTLSAPLHLALVAAAAVVVSLVSSLVPISRVRHVYPLEVFR